MTVSYKPENIQLGEKIMKRRKELNMTAAELADQASISTVTLSGIETGRISPKFDVLHRIAFVLNKPLGNPVGVTVIVPGKTVEELNIKEIGGES